MDVNSKMGQERPEKYEVRVELDKESGFCPGVIRAVECAEKNLRQCGTLYSLGAIVHNGSELQRLENSGLKVVDIERMRLMRNATVLIRAHGEPPATYDLARANNIELIDCTCPVVLKLQEKIRNIYHKGGAQVLIFGKEGHAEVNGLVGQVGGDAVILDVVHGETGAGCSGTERLDGLGDETLLGQRIRNFGKIDWNRDLVIFSQTTKDPAEYEFVCRCVRNEHARRRALRHGESQAPGTGVVENIVPVVNVGSGEEIGPVADVGIVEDADPVAKMCSVEESVSVAKAGIVDDAGPVTKMRSVEESVKVYDTICRQVSHRHTHLREFAARHAVVIFVSGAESSNGKVLYDLCKGVNPLSYHIQSIDQIQMEWFNLLLAPTVAETQDDFLGTGTRDLSCGNGVRDFSCGNGARDVSCGNGVRDASCERDQMNVTNGTKRLSVGVCGATSTPKWQLEQVASFLRDQLNR